MPKKKGLLKEGKKIINQEKELLKDKRGIVTIDDKTNLEYSKFDKNNPIKVYNKFQAYVVDNKIVSKIKKNIKEIYGKYNEKEEIHKQWMDEDIKNEFDTWAKKEDIPEQIKKEAYDSFCKD